MRRDAAYRSMQLKFGKFVAIFRHLTGTSDSCSPVQIANQCPLRNSYHILPKWVILSTLHFAIVRSLFGCFFIAGCSDQFTRTSINCPKV